MAADEKTVEQKIVAAEPKVEKKEEVKKADEGVAKAPLTPGTNKGTWASMLKK